MLSSARTPKRLSHMRRCVLPPRSTPRRDIDAMRIPVRVLVGLCFLSGLSSALPSHARQAGVHHLSGERGPIVCGECHGPRDAAMDFISPIEEAQSVQVVSEGSFAIGRRTTVWIELTSKASEVTGRRWGLSLSVSGSASNGPDHAELDATNEDLRVKQNSKGDGSITHRSPLSMTEGFGRVAVDVTPQMEGLLALYLATVDANGDATADAEDRITRSSFCFQVGEGSLDTAPDCDFNIVEGPGPAPSPPDSLIHGDSHSNAGEDTGPRPRPADTHSDNAAFEPVQAPSPPATTTSGCAARVPPLGLSLNLCALLVFWGYRRQCRVNKQPRRAFLGRDAVSSSAP